MKRVLLSCQGLMIGLLFLGGCSSIKMMKDPKSGEQVKFVQLGETREEKIQSDVKLMLGSMGYFFGVTTVRDNSKTEVGTLKLDVDGQKFSLSCDSGPANRMQDKLFAMYSVCKVPDDKREILKTAKTIGFSVHSSKQSTAGNSTDAQVKSVRELSKLK